MSTLASLLIALAAAIVKVLLQQRQAAGDAHEVGRLQAVQKGLLDAKAALEWKVEAVRSHPSTEQTPSVIDLPP